MKVINIPSPIHVKEKMSYKEKFTDKDLIRIEFDGMIPNEGWEFDDHYNWFTHRFLEKSIILDDDGNLVGAITTADKLMEFLLLKEELENYNQCLRELDDLEVNYDRNHWKPRKSIP